MDVLKGRTERSGVHNGLWPLQYEVSLKNLSLLAHFNPKLTKHTCKYFIDQ